MFQLAGKRLVKGIVQYYQVCILALFQLLKNPGPQFWTRTAGLAFIQKSAEMKVLILKSLQEDFGISQTRSQTVEALQGSCGTVLSSVLLVILSPRTEPRRLVMATVFIDIT